MDGFLDTYSTPLLIGILTLFVALNGILFEIKKDPDSPPGFRNMSPTGYALVCIIVVLGCFTGFKQVSDQQASDSSQADLAEKLSKAEQERDQIAEIIDELGQVQSGIDLNTRSIKTTTKDIENVSVENQVILGKVQHDADLSIANQAEVVKILRSLAGTVADQQGDIVALAKFMKQPLQTERRDYAKVIFDSLATGENCESSPDNQGEFYYEFYANGSPLKNPPYSITNPLMMTNNDVKNNLGSIEGIRILGANDTITVNGYVRERDPKNFLRRWTYKYDGTFSKVLPAKVLQTPEVITVLDEKDCQVKLGVKIVTYAL